MKYLELHYVMIQLFLKLKIYLTIFEVEKGQVTAIVS